MKYSIARICVRCEVCFCKYIVKMTMRIRKSLVSDTQLALEAQILYDDKSVQQVPSKINGVHTGPSIDQSIYNVCATSEATFQPWEFGRRRTS